MFQMFDLHLQKLVAMVRTEVPEIVCSLSFQQPKEFCACMPFPESLNTHISWNRPHLKPVQEDAAASSLSGN